MQIFMVRSSRLISNAAVSVVQTVISGLVLFLLYRYLINHIGTEQLGLWSVILASTSVARLSELGLTGSVVKFVARYRAQKAEEQAAEVVQTAAISIGVVMAVLALAIYPLLNVILNLTIPSAAMPQALSILPWAVLSLWLGSVGGVFQSGLDGCQRMAIRNILMIVANLLYFAAAIWLVPLYGLLGLAVGQAAQGLLLLVLSWLILRRELVALPWAPTYWSKKIFKEIFGYAINFQVSSIAIMFFDPATKLLMSKFGGLSSAAYYEMASQLVVKLRSLLISANQALVPAVAELHEASPATVPKLYLKAYRFVFFLAVPFYAAVIISLPAVSVLWIGRSEAQFLQFGIILLVGWGLNTLAAPAYFFNLGIGSLKWNSVAHVVMAVLNIFLGVVLGKIFGSLGVAIGVLAALVTGSGFLIINGHKKCNISINQLIPSENYCLLTTVACCVIFFYLANSTSFFQSNAVFAGALSLGFYALIVGISVWLHPYKKILINRRIVVTDFEENAHSDH